MHKALKQIESGEVVQCGSGYWQTCPFKTGVNLFLGTLPKEAEDELKAMYKAGDGRHWVNEAFHYIWRVK